MKVADVVPHAHIPTHHADFRTYCTHSLEGYGFIVNELATEAGIRYNNGANTVTYFGALLYKEQ